MDERIAVVKPIACRPTSSAIRSFSELLASTVDVSLINASPQAAVNAIRPKTARLKPAGSYAPVEVLSSHAEILGAAANCSSDKDSKLDSKSAVVYKPLAKLVSKTSVPLLADLEIPYINHQPAISQIEACLAPPNQVHHHHTSDISSSSNWKDPLAAATEMAVELRNKASGKMKESIKPFVPTSTMDRPSYDGYNWRKYGQKQVRGSENSRSYYKCTHPKCPVKKKVERYLDGQIAEIVYHGEHNHMKPQPQPPTHMSGGQRQGLVSDANGQDLNPSSKNQLNERNEGSESRLEDQNEVGGSTHLTIPCKDSIHNDHGAVGLGGYFTSPDDCCGLIGDTEEDIKGLEAINEPKSKRRKQDNQFNESGVSEEHLQEPRSVVPSSANFELVGDDFCWRKYGEKVMKGSTYPRSYFRCTSLKCNVRKHVERASDDPKVFITAYEGMHNHDIPIKNKNLMASGPDSKAPSSKNKL